MYEKKILFILMCVSCVYAKAYNITIDYYDAIDITKYIKEEKEPDISRHFDSYKVLIFVAFPLLPGILLLLFACCQIDDCLKCIDNFFKENGPIPDTISTNCSAFGIFIVILYLIGSVPIHVSDIPNIVVTQQYWGKMNNMTYPYVEYTDYTNAKKTILKQYCEEYSGINDRCSLLEIRNITPVTVDCGEGYYCCNSTIVCNPVCNNVCLKYVNNTRTTINIAALQRINFTYSLNYEDDTLYVTKILTCTDQKCITNAKLKYNKEYIQNVEYYYKEWSPSQMENVIEIYLSNLQYSHIVWWFITCLPSICFWLFIIGYIVYYICYGFYEFGVWTIGEINFCFFDDVSVNQPAKQSPPSYSGSNLPSYTTVSVESQA